MADLQRIKKGKTMELLAPAGSFPAFEAALQEGADAIYVGAPGFNARALSRDFTYAEIDSMIHQAHGQGVKLYIAMNSLVKENELPPLIEALSCFAQMRPDALIIQDLGLLYLARSWFPELPLHASTLMSVHNSVAAKELVRLGFERVVLARELTIEEMAAIQQKSGADIEVFIHGAMCFSYSGLCMFSSLHGGKSSLRGQCVQPCRRHYSWTESAKYSRPKGKKGAAQYLFSMNDLCGVDFLPELRDAGVSCLKIEGRMKSARYVANTVAAYRMVLDCMDSPDQEQEKVLREAHRLLDDAMARKRTSGFLVSEKPAEAISPHQSGSSGQLLGRIQTVRQERNREGKNILVLQLRLAAHVKEGDRLRLHNDKSGDRASFTLKSLQTGGRRQKKAAIGQNVQITLHGDLQGQSGKYFKGSLYKVDVGSRLVAERAGRKRRKQLARRKISPDRREVEEILNHLAWKGKTQDIGRPYCKKGRGTGKRGRPQGRSSRRELPWWIEIARLADVQQRFPVRAARIVVPLTKANIDSLARFANKIGKFKGRLVWRLPAVIQQAELSWYEKTLERLVQQGFFRFALSHCSQYGLFAFVENREGIKTLELFAHYTVNFLNSAALCCGMHLGYQGGLFSLETEGENFAAAIAHYKRQGRKNRGQQKMKTGAYVYGFPPLFTARLDGNHFKYQKPFVSPRDEQFSLEHRDGLTLARANLPFSWLKWQEELTNMGVDYMLIDLSGAQLQKEVKTVQSLLGKSGTRRQVMTGNFLGTLV
jgi:putative protease